MKLRAIFLTTMFITKFASYAGFIFILVQWIRGMNPWWHALIGFMLILVIENIGRSYSQYTIANPKW